MTRSTYTENQFAGNMSGFTLGIGLDRIFLTMMMREQHNN